MAYWHDADQEYTLIASICDSRSGQEGISRSASKLQSFWSCRQHSASTYQALQRSRLQALALASPSKYRKYSSICGEFPTRVPC
eukprot:710986-Amphidinium_carterae.1